MRPLKILIADDHEILRRGLRSILEGNPAWTVCGEAANGREAVDKARQLKPGLVILDISMPVLNGLDATREILKNAPKTQVLILTVHESEDLIQRVVDAGARGYVRKSDAGRDLVAAVDCLRQGHPFFTSHIARRMLPRDPLTARERQVIQLIAEGKSSKQVAASLGLTVKTAETHRANIMRKLDLHSVGDLVRYAVRNEITQA